MNARKFRYYFKLTTPGLALRYGIGCNVEEAMKDAGLKPDQVKRNMPVEALLTPEEIEARTKRFENLKAKKALEEAEAERIKSENLEGVIDTLDEKAKKRERKTGRVVRKRF